MTGVEEALVLQHARHVTASDSALALMSVDDGGVVAIYSSGDRERQGSQQGH